MILIRILCQRARQASEQIEDVLFRHLESRVAKTLLNLADAAGSQNLRGSPVELHVSQRELGGITGSIRERINKQLQQWHKQGLINLSKGAIMICDIAALEHLI